MNSSANSEPASTPSGPAPRAELLHVVMLPDFDRADRIGEFWSYPESRTFARTSDRLRGGPGAPGGARRDAAGVGLLSRAAIEDPRRTASGGEGHTSEGRSNNEPTLLMVRVNDQPQPFDQLVTSSIFQISPPRVTT